MKALIERLAKLIDVKSLVTICLTIVFCVMELKGNISQEFMNVYTVVIAFYFGTQYAKNKKE
jgi:hypothetical protein